MNLREVLKKYGKHVGISLGAVRSYAHQVNTPVECVQFGHESVSLFGPPKTIVPVLGYIIIHCPCYPDSPVNGDPTSVPVILVNGTPRYQDNGYS